MRKICAQRTAGTLGQVDRAGFLGRALTWASGIAPREKIAVWSNTDGISARQCLLTQICAARRTLRASAEVAVRIVQRHHALVGEEDPPLVPVPERAGV